MITFPQHAVHVLHVVPTLGVGGLELTMSCIVRELGKRGIQHSIVCLKGEAAIRDRFDDVVRIHCMNAKPNDPRLTWRLRKLICDIRPAVIHARNWGAWPDVALARLTVRPRVPLVFSFHGLDRSLPLPWRQRAAMRVLARLTTYVFAVSEESREMLVRHVGLRAARVGLIPNGVDTRRFTPGQRRSGIGRLTIGSVGGLRPVKNYPLLVQACARLASSGLDVEVRLAGDGPERVRLAALARSLGIKDRLLLVGNVDDVPAFLRGLDIFVLPSRTEGHPNALIEAMACGLPCVATRVGGSPEVLEHGRCGMLVPLDDMEALVSAVTALARSPQERDRLGYLARESVTRRYSLDRMLGAYETLYASLGRDAGACGWRGGPPPSDHAVDDPTTPSTCERT